jgi:hypothetical protein
MDAATAYSKMSPIDQYLMADRISGIHESSLEAKTKNDHAGDSNSGVALGHIFYGDTKFRLVCSSFDVSRGH